MSVAQLSVIVSGFVGAFGVLVGALGSWFAWRSAVAQRAQEKQKVKLDFLVPRLDRLVELYAELEMEFKRMQDEGEKDSLKFARDFAAAKGVLNSVIGRGKVQEEFLKFIDVKEFESDIFRGGIWALGAEIMRVLDE